MNPNQLDLETLQRELQEIAWPHQVVIQTDTALLTIKRVARVDNTILITINPDRVYAIRERERLRNYLIKRIGGIE